MSRLPRLQVIGALVIVGFMLRNCLVASSAPSVEPVTDSETKAIAVLKEHGAVIKTDRDGHAISVSFQNMKGVQSSWLEPLPSLTRLERLVLYRSDAPDDALKHVTGSKTLIELQLSVENTDESLKYVSTLAQLKKLHMGETKITDEGLARIADLKHLNTVWLYEATFTGKGLKHLERLERLESLYMGSPAITDESLATVAKMKQLVWLGVSNTQVTDEGLKQLKGLTRLKVVFAGNTKVTKPGAEWLMKAIPGCNVTYE